MTSLRIRFLTTAVEWGGTEVHTAALARVLAGRGHDVSVVVAGTGSDAELQRARFRAAGVPALAVTGTWGTLRAAVGDVGVLTKGSIDAGTFPLELIARLRFGRLVTIEHSTCPMPERTTSRHFGVRGVGLWWYRRLAGRRLRALAPCRVICVSDAVRQQLVGRYGFDGRKTVVIRSGVDGGRFRRDDARGASRRSAWGIPAGALVFGAVGRLCHVKNYELALDAFARAVRRTSGRDLRLVLAGTGPSGDDLRALAGALGIAAHVIFAGFAAHPEDVYSAIDVFLMPSLKEGLPLALLEAMACECWPIATAVGGIPEILDRSDVGSLVSAGDADPFRLAVELAARMPAHVLRAMGARARHHVAQKFDAQAQFAALADEIQRTSPSSAAGSARAERVAAEHVEQEPHVMSRARP